MTASRPRFAAASLAIALGAWALVAALDGWTRTVALPPLVDAEVAAVAAATPPDAAADWRPTTLPDDWEREGRTTVEAWYRLRLPATEGVPGRAAVYLPVLRMNAAVWVNGRFVGDGGRFDEPVARNWTRPLSFPVPDGVRAAGGDVLHVRVKADRAGGGLLGPVYVGPAAPLRAAYERRYFFAVTLLRAIAVSQVVLLLFIGALWLRRRDAAYGWFAAASLAWSLTWPNLLVVHIPVPLRVWTLVWHLAGGWFILCLVGFALEFIRERTASVTRGLLAYGAAGSTVLVALAAADAPWLQEAGARAWVAPQFVLGAWAVGRVAAALRRDPGSFELRVCYASGLVIAGCALQDWPILLGLRGGAASFYVPYTAPVCQVAMGGILLRRMVAALRRSEALAADLDRRFEEARRDLERSAARTRELERSRLLSEERERLMREMHDGLGSRLVSTLALVERSDGPAADVGAAVRATLDDLRLMVESLEPIDGDLLSALAQLRSRLQPRLEAAGLRVAWQAADVPAIAGLGPRTVLQVLRIVEEAITNVLKHAAARTLAIRTALVAADGGAPMLSIEVADDGRGFPEAPSRGWGMDNMRRRAREIHAVLDVQSSAAGTVVRLSVPHSWEIR